MHPNCRCNCQRIAIECAAWRPHTYWNPLQLSFGVSATEELFGVRGEGAVRHEVTGHCSRWSDARSIRSSATRLDLRGVEPLVVDVTGRYRRIAHSRA